MSRMKLAKMPDDRLRNCALFLDLDGTLIDIAETPDAVRVPPDLATLISRLTETLDGAVAIITGRPVAEVDRFLAPLKPVAAGSHGAELRTVAGGEIERAAGPVEPEIVDAVQALGRAHPGVIVEKKPSSIAIHYRLAPEAGSDIEAGLERILDSGPDHLILCPGRKVFEVVPRHISKGTALERLLGPAPFRGRRPIMIGDDVSDQSALDVATRLGGIGLRVAGEHFHRDAADFGGTAEVRAWLSGLVERLAA